LLYDERSNPLSPQIIPLSNMGGTGLAEVASHPGISANGAYDMAGNVREWCYNPSGDERYSLGGDWDDPPYYFLQPTVQSPWERSDGNGFRCAYYPECTKVPASLLQECIQGSYEYVNDPPVSDEMLKIFTNMAAYERTPLNPVIESTQKNKNGWTSETVTIDAAYGSERIILHLDIPIDGNPPYKVVIYFPGLYTMMSNFYSREPHYEPWDFIPKSGRVFVTPVCSGWWERGGGPSIARWYNTHSVQKMFTEWVQDLGRTIDYLETRPDIDSEKVAYLGFSMGALVAPYMIVGEKRIRTAILISGGMGYDIGKFENDNIPRLNSYLPRVKIPILMLNGKYDYTFPFEKTQKPFFNLLGTPLEHKRHVVYEAGHSPLPRVELIKETLAWLDKYQGPVGKKPD
jgi:dienelactone hydrolase